MVRVGEKNNRPIGIFDSGVGGLTVAGEFLKELPNEEIIYFGDTARVPYGSKTKEIVTKYSAQIVKFLLSRNVKAIVIACNTVSSNSYDYLTEKFGLPMVEVVSPGAAECAMATKNNIVGVIGTWRTVSSGAYEWLIKKANPDITVYQKACPLFVPLAEEGWVDNEVAAATAEIYLRELIGYGIDSLLLACTHYPLLMETIKKVAAGITVINPAKATALKMKALLEEKNLQAGDSRDGQKTAPKHTFYVSDNCDKFSEISKLVLGKEINAEIVDIEGY